MTWEEEIKYRTEIMSRACNGEKITREDRLWLLTHRAYNRSLGYPYLNCDIIQLQPRFDYRLIIKLERNTYPHRIAPIIAVPGGKGGILCSDPVYDSKGNVKIGKAVKMLEISLDSVNTEYEVAYRSDLGLLGVSYGCDYYDEKMKLTIRESSNTGNTSFAMTSEKIEENKIQYRCKIPLEDGFDRFVFSVEWHAAVGLKGK